MRIGTEVFQYARQSFRSKNENLIKDEKDENQKNPEQECNDLIVGYTRCKKPYAHEHSGHEKETNISANNRTVIQRANRSERHVIDKRGKEGNPHEAPRGKELSQNNFRVMNRFGGKKFDGAGFSLLGQQPHCDCRNNKEENPACDLEHFTHRCHIHEENITGIKPAQKCQKNDNNHIRYRGIEVRSQFLDVDRANIVKLFEE